MIQKYSIGFIIILLIGFKASSQNEKFDFFISTGILSNELPKTTRIAWINDFGISKNRNLYKIGLIAQIYTDNAESLSESLKLTGGHLGYGRIVPTQKKWLNLELKSDMNIQHFKSVWQSNVFSEELQQYQEFKYQLGETLFDLSIGYGLKINLSRSFYLTQSFSGGIFYSRINSDELSQQAPEVVDEYFDFRSYGNTGFQWNIMFTFGYYITRK